MKTLWNRIRYSVSLRVGVNIVLFVVLVFLLSLGFLFIRSRQLVRQEVLERGAKAVSNVTLRVVGYFNEVELVTQSMQWHLRQNSCPDSLLSYTRRVVELNPNVCGCSITMEPDFFPASEGKFSAYSVRNDNGIETVREDKYDYYNKVWYETPKRLGHACWIEPTTDDCEGSLKNSDMIISYCMPIHDADGRFIGVISTDLSLPWLSNVFATDAIYPHSYSVMLSDKGHYFVHPDTTRIMQSTIYDDVDFLERINVNKIEQELHSRRVDYVRTRLNGTDSYAFFKPLMNTGWTIGLICPEDDVLRGYNRLGYIILVLITVGLLLIFYFSRRAVNRFIAPLNQLVSQLHNITMGNFSEHVPRIERDDLVAQLQNSFVNMQLSLDGYISRLHQANEEAERQNQELKELNVLVQESNRRKQAFIQDISHQIRTPLNIIQGFLVVLRDVTSGLPDEQKAEILETMHQNIFSLRRMTNMLIDASWLERGLPIDCSEVVGCNHAAREVVDTFNVMPPFDVELNFRTSVPDSFSITTEHRHLLCILRELLYNAKRYGQGAPVSLTIEATDDAVCFIVEDRGPGIPESQRELIFTHFTKLNSFSEGLGLGLNLSRRFARKMGGDLVLQPAEDHGCRFVLSLPL